MGLLPLFALAGEYNTTSMERAVVDMKPKDCLGNSLAPPPVVQVGDFAVSSRDLATNKVAPVPVRLLRYDHQEGTAEIMFPFRKGAVYEVDVATHIKEKYANCPGKPVATE